MWRTSGFCEWLRHRTNSAVEGKKVCRKCIFTKYGTFCYNIPRAFKWYRDARKIWKIRVIARACVTTVVAAMEWTEQDSAPAKSVVLKILSWQAGFFSLHGRFSILSRGSGRKNGCGANGVHRGRKSDRGRALFRPGKPDYRPRSREREDKTGRRTTDATEKVGDHG